VSVPRSESGPAAGTAWHDCATSTLTRNLNGVVAPSALLYITETTSVSRSVLDRVGRTRFAVALGVVLLVIVGASLLGSRRLLRPVRRLTSATAQMTDGDLDTRVDVTGRDEVAELARSFNAMAGALSEADGQRRRMVHDIAHELRTPLANIRGYLEAGHDGVLPRDDAWTESLIEETALLQHVIDDLQVLAEADAGRLVVTPTAEDLAATAEVAVRALRAQADARGVRVEVTGTAYARHDPLRMRQVVANLVANAVRYAPESSVVSVTLGNSDRDGTTARLVVRDHGPGIDEEHLERVFERFYRADPSRSRETGGSGLGLAIVRQIVEAHGGAVTVGNAPGGGAVFTVMLPPGPTGSW
jgi:two-component system sensor histidine kinase BaeS